MSPQRSRLAIRTEVIEEAAGWLIEFRTGSASAAERRVFDSWLRASPEHVRAYLELLPIWENGARIDRSALPDPKVLLDWARSGSDNVIAIDTLSAVREPGRVRRHIIRPLAIAASAAIVALGTWYYMQRDTYSTAVGEQRSITMSDGSTVRLNALSRIRLRLDKQQRSVDLLAGQALFRVAHDKDRPFIVHSDGTKVRAIGTQFDVYRKAGDTTVTVIEGRVAVTSPSPSRSSGDSLANTAPAASGALATASSPIYLSAGEKISVQPAAAPVPAKANISVAIAWTQQRLIFSGTPLTEVADEFNRYNTRRLVIEGTSLEDFRINGIFSSTNPAALLNFLREQEGISVTETNREIRVSHD